MPQRHKSRKTVVPPREWLARVRRPKYSGAPALELSPTDETALSRLVRKYAKDTVVIATAKVPLRRAGRPARGHQPTPLAPLSLIDTKQLARLVGKYGHPFIATMANDIVPRGSGRPKGLPNFDPMHVADWINECAEEHRARGSRHPKRDAALELHDLVFGYEAELSEAWLKTIRNKCALGEQHFRALAAHIRQRIQQRPDLAGVLRRQLRALPRWLKTHKK